MTESAEAEQTGILARLRRRKVVQWGIAYAAAAWGILQGVAYLRDTFGWPHQVQQVATIALLVGLPIALVIAWYHGERGQQRVSGAELVIVTLLLVTGGLLWRAVPVEPPQGSAPAAGEPGAGQRTASEAAGRSAGSTAGDGAAGQAAQVSGKSIAVLPFVPLSQGADDAYFADGLTEEILNALARLPDLKVTARTSAFHFKGTSMPVPEIARQLGVANVLEGSVRRSGNRVRVTAQLIRAQDGFHLWSQDYDRESADTIEIQDDIAQRVAAALDVLLDDSRRAAMKRGFSSDVEAFVAFQKARGLYEKAHTRVSGDSFIPMLREANALFDVALAAQPDLFAARLLSADVYAHQLIDPLTWDRPPPLSPAQAQEAAAAVRDNLNLALQNAHSESERNSAAYTLNYLSDDWTGLSAASTRQLADRNCVESEFNDAPLAYGHGAEALGYYRSIIACDPFVPDYYWSLASAELWLSDPKAALDVIAESRHREAADVRTGWIEMIALMALGRIDAARAIVNGMPAGDRYTRGQLEVVLAAGSGEADAARTRWAALRPSDHVPRMDITLLAWMGDRNGATAVARRLDSQPFGHVALAEITRHCYCGAPFDIEQTPNFKARIAESGFAWPPKKPVPIPLKDW